MSLSEIPLFVAYDKILFLSYLSMRNSLKICSLVILYGTPCLFRCFSLFLVLPVGTIIAGAKRNKIDFYETTLGIILNLHINKFQLINQDFFNANFKLSSFVQFLLLINRTHPLEINDY